MASEQDRQQMEENFNMECYTEPAEEEEDLEVEEEEFSEDDEQESEDEFSGDDELEREIIVRGNRPHEFEPLARDVNNDIIDAARNEQGAILNQWRNTDPTRLENVDNWCNCGHCKVLETFQVGDCTCCQEIPEVVAEATRQNIQSCITVCDSFEPAILNPISLYIGWLEYTERWRQAAKSFEARNNEKYRYVAYRKFVRWCWGWLGRDIRVQLPACTHARIMEAYPDEEGQYKGTILRELDI